MSGTVAWIGVALAGALGAYSRYRLSVAIARWRSSAFPWGTFVVNLTGSFALGLLVGLDLAGDALLVAGTGFLGAYTTFSTWMLEAVRLGEDGRVTTMMWYLAGSMLAGLAVAGTGWLLGAALG
jgi:CrcB protein